jgi:hypothetical protein
VLPRIRHHGPGATWHFRTVRAGALPSFDAASAHWRVMVDRREPDHWRVMPPVWTASVTCTGDDRHVIIQPVR